MLMSVVLVASPWWCSCPWCHSSALSSRKKNTSPTAAREQQCALDAAFEGLGQQVHEGGGQQRAGRQAQQVLRVHAARAAAHAHLQQEGREPDAADAGDQGRRDDDYQIHSCLRKRDGRRDGFRAVARS
jgi:hypothetical protein